MSDINKLIECKECKEKFWRHQMGGSCTHSDLNLRFHEEGFCSYSCKLKNKGIEQSAFLKEAMRMIMKTGVSCELNETSTNKQHDHGLHLKPWFIAFMELIDEHMEKGVRHDEK